MLIIPEFNNIRARRVRLMLQQVYKCQDNELCFISSSDPINWNQKYHSGKGFPWKGLAPQHHNLYGQYYFNVMSIFK